VDKEIKKKAKKAYEIAYEYEKKYGECSQCTIRALQEAYSEINSNVFRAIGGLAGGGGSEGDGTCGAYAACLYFFSSKYGRRFEDLDRDKNDPRAGGFKKNLYFLIESLHNKFMEEYGTIICSQLHRKIFGRPFYHKDADDLKKFDEMGGHEKGCPHICGNAAKWTVEIYENFINGNK
jgi:hypothetical protein